MSTNLRLGYDPASVAPPPDWNDLDHCGHVVQFYSDDSFLLEGLSRFIGSALGAGDAAIVIATEAHRDELTLRLQALGLDTARSIKQGRFVSLDAAETLSKFMVDGWPDEARFEEVVGGVLKGVTSAVKGGLQPRVAAFGEMVALLWADGQGDAAIRLEQLWNDLAKKHSFYLHCAYPMSGFAHSQDGDPILKICAEHSHVIPAESYTELSTEPDRLRSIALLQQKAQALETEVVERRQIEKSLRRRESELAEILENAVEGVQQVGPDQRILWANQALLKLLGYPAEEYVNHQLSEFHVHRHIFDEFWQKLMRREDIYDFPAELRCKDGSVKHVRIHSNGLWEDGQFIHTRCFVRDVTENMRMEEALRKSEKLAVAGRFAATVAHEINNPLEALRNLIHLARTAEEESKYSAHYLTLADSELSRVAQITKRFLGFYREKAEPVPIKVSEVLDEVVAMLGPTLDRKGLRIERRYERESQVLASTGHIRQIILNLVTNAVDACERGEKIILHVRTATDWHNGYGRGVQIVVADTGHGIPREERHKIFEPFFTTKQDVGTGLGLWITKQLVEDYGGRIRVRSSQVEGHSGTTFSMFFPKRVASQHGLAA
ncbi:MAG TPA: ATP-binding protein [Terriglobales bacterium]|nr:ATP-binding protein [Terriglobales bacterium]